MARLMAIVLDNTCGSGSFLVSAVLEERNFIGIEKNHEVHRFKNKEIDYIDVCEQRVAAAYESLEKEWEGNHVYEQGNV